MHPYFDLNDDEREEYRHAELALQATARFNSPQQQRVFRQAHDRIYKEPKLCAYCNAPRLSELEKVYNRTPLEPTTTLDEKRANQRDSTGDSLKSLLDEIMGYAHDPDRE
jgi:hypothetical protein